MKEEEEEEEMPESRATRMDFQREGELFVQRPGGGEELVRVRG